MTKAWQVSGRWKYEGPALWKGTWTGLLMGTWKGIWKGFWKGKMKGKMKGIWKGTWKRRSKGKGKTVWRSEPPRQHRGDLESRRGVGSLAASTVRGEAHSTLRDLLVGLLILLACGSVRAEVSFAGGDGSELNPWQIATLEQLKAISDNPAAHYILVADISAPSDEILSLQTLEGSLDGGGHAIDGITNQVFSLFMLIDSGATVSNLRLTNVQIRPSEFGVIFYASMGGLAATNKGNIFDTHVSGSVFSDPGMGNFTGAGTGGLVGSNEGTIGSSSFSGTVSTENFNAIGGLVGYNTGSILGGSATGNVQGNNYVGGLVGANEVARTSTLVDGVTLIEVGEAGRILGSDSASEVAGAVLVGGLAGFNGGLINSSHATGNVVANSTVGGLVGTNLTSFRGLNEAGAAIDARLAVIRNSHASGNVSASAGYAGGLVGYDSSGVISGSHAIGDVDAGMSTGGGLVGGLAISKVTINTGNGFVPYEYPRGSTIFDSYAHGQVSGADKVGGLVGESTYAIIDTSYATGLVVSDGANAGGLLGLSDDFRVRDSFWDLQTSGRATSAAGVGKTTAELLSVHTYAGTTWDLATIWCLDPTAGYPTLRGASQTDEACLVPAPIPGDLDLPAELLTLFQLQDPDAQVIEDADTGVITIATEGQLAALLPVQVEEDESGLAAGTYVTDDGDLLLITESGFAVHAVPMLLDEQVFAEGLALLGLDFELGDFANLAVSTPDGSRRYIARPAPAYPAVHGVEEGLIGYLLDDPVNVIAYAVLLRDGSGVLMEQPLVPLPADWQSLRDRLWQVPGIETVQIGADGIISVVIQGLLIQGRTSYLVLGGTASGADGLLLQAAGDLNGDGTGDLTLVYPNGDTQLLYIYP